MYIHAKEVCKNIAYIYNAVYMRCIVCIQTYSVYIVYIIFIEYSIQTYIYNKYTYIILYIYNIGVVCKSSIVVCIIC